MHEQTLVKVNAFVDRGIAPLVLALNSIEGVITLDSCQKGDCGTEPGMAYVYFTYGQSWTALGHLLEWIAAQTQELDLCCGFSVRLEWFGSNDKPRAQISVKPEHVIEVAEALQRSQFTPRMFQSVCDK